jgi:hypothetical protein
LVYNISKEVKNKKAAFTKNSFFVKAANKKMIDDIGFGKNIADIISVILFVLALGGGSFFILIKHRYIGLIWTSFFLNLLSVFYFLGGPSVALAMINYYVWPLVNLIITIFLFIKYKRSKNEINK